MLFTSSFAQKKVRGKRVKYEVKSLQWPAMCIYHILSPIISMSLFCNDLPLLFTHSSHQFPCDSWFIQVCSCLWASTLAVPSVWIPFGILLNAFWETIVSASVSQTLVFHGYLHSLPQLYFVLKLNI